jgi:hypothetical protein
LGFQLSQLALTRNNKSLFGGCAGTPQEAHSGFEGSKMCLPATRNFSSMANDIKKSDVVAKNRSLGVIKYFRNMTNFLISDTIQAHDERGVSRLILANSDRFLVSAGHDGMLFLLEIKDSESKAMTETPKFVEEILATRNEVDELRTRKDLLASSLQENQFQTSNTINLNDLDDKIRYLNEQLILREKNEQEIVQEQMEKRDQVFLEREAERKAVLVSHEEELTEFEHIFNKELAKESRKIEKLKTKQKTAEREQAEQLRLAAEKMENEAREVTAQFEEKLREKEAEIAKLAGVS